MTLALGAGRASRAVARGAGRSLDYLACAVAFLARLLFASGRRLGALAQWLVARGEVVSKVGTADLQRAVDDAVRESGGGLKVTFKVARCRVVGRHATLVAGVRALIEGARREAPDARLTLLVREDEAGRVHVNVRALDPEEVTRAAQA